MTLPSPSIPTLLMAVVPWKSLCSAQAKICGNEQLSEEMALPVWSTLKLGGLKRSCSLSHHQSFLACLHYVVHRNPNSEGLVEWPVYNLDEEYLELNLKQKRAKKLKENRVEFWTRVLPEKIKEKLKDTKQHSEL